MTNLELAIEALHLDQWMTSYEIQHWARNKYGVMMSESGLTARLREASKQGHKYECRRRSGTKSYEYKRILPLGSQNILNFAPWTSVPKEMLMSDEDFQGF